MYREITLHEGLALTCPECGSDELTVRRVQVNNPRDTIIDIELNPLFIGMIDGGDGRPYVTLTLDCPGCPPDVGLYLHFSADAEGRTTAHWDTDSPDNPLLDASRARGSTGYDH